ncbi:MAG: SctK family type III secretion system sorting platform protein [Pseudomonas sp.]|nr:SctK family type III secretion system sorting platform protein [Pseudomonas sp.]
MTEFQLRYCPANYLHLNHCPGALSQVAPALPLWRESCALNGWLMSVLGLSEPFDVPERLGKLAYYPQPVFERVLSSLGGLLHGRAIKQLLDPEGQTRLRQALDLQDLRHR